MPPEAREAWYERQLRKARMENGVAIEKENGLAAGGFPAAIAGAREARPYNMTPVL